ncbi:hypothetical protein KY348_07445 [Candidatus Woesearchaeota archaeon]|nr:hypothetical protein [Candidatus Woesearchaeota archaeon]
MDLYQKLVDYGLTEKEAKIYLATLELGMSTVNTIAKKSKIFRTYCYDILRSLSEKGLVTSIIKKQVKYYEVVDPSKFVQLLHDKEEKIKEAIPQLQMLKATAVFKPITEVFEGKEGIKSIHMDILQTGVDHYVLGTSTTIIKFLGPWFDYYVKERVKRNIKVKVLTNKSPEAQLVLKNAKRDLREVKYYPLTNDINTTTYIYGNKIAMVMYAKEKFGVIIQSQELAQTQKTIFETLWKIAEKPEKR